MQFDAYSIHCSLPQVFDLSVLLAQQAGGVKLHNEIIIQADLVNERAALQLMRHAQGFGLAAHADSSALCQSL